MFFFAIWYQPLKWLATSIKPRWGFLPQLINLILFQLINLILFQLINLMSKRQFN